MVSLMEMHYKYIIDTSSILSQKDKEPHRRSVYKQKWDNIDNLVKSEIIITCSEIAEEVKDSELDAWMHNITIVPIDDEVQENVKTVVSVNKQLIDFKNNKSSGDAFLIATAMKYNLTVITEERNNSPKTIPQCCENLNIPCVNILGLCELEGWVF